MRKEDLITSMEQKNIIAKNVMNHKYVNTTDTGVIAKNVQVHKYLFIENKNTFLKTVVALKM